MAALRTDCFSVGHQFFGNNLLFVFQLEFYYLIFPLSTAQAARFFVIQLYQKWLECWIFLKDTSDDTTVLRQKYLVY